MSNEGRMTDPVMIHKFLLAGNARVTLVSEKTGVRFTYKVRQATDEATGKPKDFWFVSLLTGSNNEDDFQYLGTIDRNWDYKHGWKSRVTGAAPSAKGWDYFWRHLTLGIVAPKLEVWHEGRCGRCARPLTVPSSIETGFGPDCAALLGI